MIQTKPVGMRSRHDFLNCPFVVQSELSAAQLKAEFVTMELAHGRDRGNPLCKVTDRPSTSTSWPATRGCLAGVGVDAYLGDLLAEMYEGGRVGAHKVTLRLRTSRCLHSRPSASSPSPLRQPGRQRQELSAVPPDMPAHQANHSPPLGALITTTGSPPDSQSSSITTAHNV